MDQTFRKLPKALKKIYFKSPESETRYRGNKSPKYQEWTDARKRYFKKAYGAISERLMNNGDLEITEGLHSYYYGEENDDYEQAHYTYEDLDIPIEQEIEEDLTNLSEA